MEKFFDIYIYVTQASSPVKFLTTRIVCGVAASEFLLAASLNLYFCWLRFGMMLLVCR